MVRMMNLNPEPIRLDKGQKFAVVDCLSIDAMTSMTSAEQESIWHLPITIEDFDLTHLDHPMKMKLWDVLSQYLDVFSKSSLDFGCTDLITHKITLTDQKHDLFSTILCAGGTEF